MSETCMPEGQPMKGTGEKELPVHEKGMCLSNVDHQDPLQKFINSAINVSQLQPSRAASSHSPIMASSFTSRNGPT